jgi:hypothetical protein
MQYVVLRFCSILFAMAAFVAPVMIVQSGPRNQECGLPVFPVLAFAGFSMIGLFLVAFAFEGSAKRSRNPRRPPDMLRSVAALCARDGKFDEAVRWQTEAVRFASWKWIAEYEAELEEYKNQKLQGK